MTLKRVPQGMADEIALPVVERAHPAQFRLDRPQLPRTPPHVVMQRGDGSPDDLGMVNSELASVSSPTGRGAPARDTDKMTVSIKTRSEDESAACPPRGTAHRSNIQHTKRLE
jgi:hypothetical protein